MQEKIEFLSYIFIECMIFNDRIFSEKDFKTLLRSQRLDDQYEYFDDNAGSSYKIKLNNLNSVIITIRYCV